MSKEKHVYMKLDKNYDLPVAVADDAYTLAKMVGCTPNLIYSCISHAKKRGGKSKFVKVLIDD